MKVKELLRGSPDFVKRPVGWVWGQLPPRLRFGRSFLEILSFLEESQWWSWDKLREYQSRQLRELLYHAYENVTYYRAVLDGSQLRPEDICNLEDLAKIPLLTKDIIKRRKGEFISKIHKRNLVETHTGGSTGSPLRFWHEKSFTRSREEAFFWRMRNWHGYYWGDKCLVIAGSCQVGERIGYSPRHGVLYVYNPLITLEKAKDYLRLIESFKPKVIEGYPSLIYLIAHVMNRYGIRIRCPSLRTIFCRSEKVFDFQREEIREAFNCKVVDYYGHTERLVLMQKCEKNADYHVISEYGITEFIGKNGEPIAKEGDIGEIVGTGFNNYAFPMIRYRTGDWAVVSKRRCDCGRAYPLVKEIIGRSGDFILTPSGKMISPTILEPAMDYINGFKDIQIVQVDIDMVEIQIVPDVSYTEEEGKGFAKKLRDRIGEDLSVRIALVEEIERPSNQKRRFVRSDISRSLLEEGTI